MHNYDYTTPLYPIREAANAAGFEVNTLRSLYQRSHFRIIGGEEAKARGLAHMLNLRDTMHIAAARRLMDVGVHPKDAFGAAINFAHVGKGQSGWVGGEASGQTRIPAGVFDTGFTVLLYFPTTGLTRILPVKDSIGFGDLFFDPASHQRANPVIVLLNDVERDVFCALGVVAIPE